MDAAKMRMKKNVLVKAWERCFSLGRCKKPSSLSSSSSGNTSCYTLRKSKSCHSSTTTRSNSLEEEANNKEKRRQQRQVAPEGCFSVYVGPQRQRFMVKTELANHPLFKMLLEDAELEYGFSSEGPLLLPCDVDLFYKVLAEMDSGKEVRPLCRFAYSPLILCSPSQRRISTSNKGHGSYKLLTPSRMLKLNS